MSDVGVPVLSVRLDEDAPSPYRVVVEVAGTTLRGDAGHFGYDDRLPGVNGSSYKRGVTLACVLEQWSRTLEDLEVQGGIACLPYSFGDELIGCLAVDPRGDGNVHLRTVELPIRGMDVLAADFDGFWRPAGALDDLRAHRVELDAEVAWADLVRDVDSELARLSEAVSWLPNPRLRNATATISGGPHPVVVTMSRREAPFSPDQLRREVWRGRVSGVGETGPVERLVEVDADDLRALGRMLRAVGPTKQGDAWGAFGSDVRVWFPAPNGPPLWSVSLDELGLVVMMEPDEREMTIASCEALADRLERAPFGHDPTAPPAE